MVCKIRHIHEFLRLPDQAEDMSPDLRQAARQTFAAVSSVHGIAEVEMPIIPVREMRGKMGQFVHTGDIARRIALGVDSWRPEVMAAHEIGHFIDWSALPGDGKYASKWITIPSMRDLIRRIHASETWTALQWDDEDFLPIAEALDALFEERGWLVKASEYRTTTLGVL